MGALLPNLIVIGARKAGTSSLHNYLDLHPEIAMSRQKELDFFIGPGSSWDRGLGWYESQFDARAPVRGESSPVYTAYPYVTGVPDRIRSAVPDVRLIYLVRDPIERLLSEYTHRWTRGWERRPLAKLIARDDFQWVGYVTQSRYHLQIEQYLRCFPLDRILVVDQRELRDRPAATMERIFRFLGVDAGFSSEGFGVVHNAARSFPVLKAVNRVTRSMYPPQALYRSRIARRLDSTLSRRVEHRTMAASVRERLAGCLAEDARRFRELTGCAFGSWTV